MPKITEITLQTKNKNRCNLFLDGEFFVSLSIETVVKNRLKKGQVVDRIKLADIILKTKKQVKEYLLKKGYSEDIAWHCVDKLKEYNYINDEEYTKRYIESVSKTQGKRMVEYKLMMKGIKKEDIGAAYDGVEIDAKQNAKNLAIKHLKNKEKNKENLAKTYRYLLGKGFSYEEANFALSELKEDD